YSGSLGTAFRGSLLMITSVRPSPILPAAAAALLAPALIVAQPPERAAAVQSAVDGTTGPTWSPPRTAWGDPDLEGMWPLDYINGTPVQRPPEFGERRYLTDEEYAERAARLAALNARYEQEIATNRM